MKTVNILLFLILVQAFFFAVSCQEDHVSLKKEKEEPPKKPKVFENVGTISGIEGAIQTRVAAGTDGTFHMVCLMPSKTVDNQPVAGTFYYLRFQNEKWETPLKIAEPGLNQTPIHFADIAADSRGNAYVVWVNKNRNLFYSVKIDANNNIQTETRKTRAALRADVTVDQNDIAYALYRDKRPEENHLLKRTPENDTWTEAGKAPDNHTDTGQRQPAIIAGKENILFYGFRWMDGGASNRRIGFRTYNTETNNWGQVSRPSSPEKPWGPQLTVDTLNRLHMFWGAGYQPNTKIYYRAPNGKITSMGKGLGEKSWPPAAAVASSGDIMVAITEGKKYHDISPSGKVFIYVISEGKVIEHFPVEETQEKQGWGHLAYCFATRKLMVVWVASEKIKFNCTEIK